LWCGVFPGSGIWLGGIVSPYQNFLILSL